MSKVPHDRETASSFDSTQKKRTGTSIRTAAIAIRDLNADMHIGQRNLL